MGRMLIDDNDAIVGLRDDICLVNLRTRRPAENSRLQRLVASRRSAVRSVRDPEQQRRRGIGKPARSETPGEG